MLTSAIPLTNHGPAINRWCPYAMYSVTFRTACVTYVKSLCSVGGTTEGEPTVPRTAYCRPCDHRTNKIRGVSTLDAILPYPH